jgi:all-trans-retinol 13,14-reductase
MVFLGVDMDLSGYPTIIKNMDEGCDIVINSNADASLAPKGKASITILTFANYHDFPERGTDDYMRKKQELSEALIKKAEKVIPDLSRHPKHLKDTPPCLKGPSTRSTIHRG